MPTQEAISLMEERAKRFSYFSEFIRALPAPGTDAEIKNEINYLTKRMNTLSKETRSTREILNDLQKQFTFYANYKYALEKTITPLTLVVSPKKKDKWTLLEEKIDSLTEEEKEKIKVVELWEKGRKRNAL